MQKLFVEDNDALKIHFDEMSKIPLLTREEEPALIKKAHEGDKAARDKVISANMKFVAKIAMQYRNRGVEYEDLLSEGYLGLMRALDHFDENKGYHFISYAVWWIRQGMLKAISDYGRVIRLPANKEVELHKLNRTLQDVRHSGRKSREEELEGTAKTLGMSKEYVQDLINISREMISLDDSKGDGSDETLLNTTEDTRISPEKDAMDSCLNSEIKEMISSLDKKSSYVLDMRYGLSGQGERTLKDLGKKMNLSRERVRQIELGAIKKLRSSERCREVLMDYVA